MTRSDAIQTKGIIHILYDVAYPFIEGGGQKRMFEVAKRLLKKGWAIRWYSFKTWEGESELQRGGITYIGLPGFVPLYNSGGRRSYREVVAFAQVVWRYRRAIRNADIIWCGQWPYFHLFSFLVRRQGCLVVDWWETWGRHWFGYAGPIMGSMGFVIEKLFVRVCSRRGTLVTISRRGTQDAFLAGAKHGSTQMIPNGIDGDAISRVPAAKNQVDLLYLGRLKNHKNIDHILRAVYILRENQGLVVSIAIIGEGPEEATLRAISNRLNLDRQITFLGAVTEEEKFSWMKAARLFIHPSTKEGGGSITLLEAQACGTPVLIYDSPTGIDSSYVDGQKTGWCVSPITPCALSERIYELIKADKLRKEIVGLACRHAAASYTWDNVAKRYDDLFISVLQQRFENVETEKC